MAIYQKIKLDSRFEKLPLRGLFIASLIINLIVILLALLSRLILPPQIPLLYGLPQTAEQLVNSIFIILPSTLALVMTIINAFISIFIESTYLKKVLAFTSISLSLLALIGTFKIIFLVGAI